MDIGGMFGGATDILGKGASKLSQLKWVFIVLIVLALLIGVIYWLRMANNKKKQWTHTLKVKRIMANGQVLGEVVHKMRRFPLERGVEMFELEKPLLGSFIIPQPGEYTGLNEFSIILDPNNRIWIDKGTKFNKDTQSLEVSAVHAGIDVEMSNMRDKWQQAHKVNKKITTAELIIAGLKALGIVAIVILGIVAIQEWGDSQTAKAEVATQEAIAMAHISEAVKTMQTVVNTQQLQIIPMLKALYGDNNIVAEINKYRPVNETNK